MFPRVKLESLELSKIVCGTNQFIGITHRANPIDIWLHKRRFRDPRTVADFFIYLVQEHGINCIVSSPREKLYRALEITERETGERMHWLCTPSIRRSVRGLECDIFKQIDWCADHGVEVCMPHRIYTDLVINKEDLTIGGTAFDDLKGRERMSAKVIVWAIHLYTGIPVASIKGMWQFSYPEISARIRDRGMIPGLSTHYVESIKAVEKNGYDASLVIQPLNLLGYQSNTDPDELVKVIRNTKLQIL
ncbi:MAG: hypothetical protein ACTSRA_15590, partial [Promethearchaeota archaeon]